VNRTRDIKGGVEPVVVMMVDDEPTTLDVIEALLQTEGYQEFHKVVDPRQAFALAKSLRPDVLLLNLMMPHVNGLEILKAMQQDAFLCGLPVLVITGSKDVDLKRRALELGAADFLSKPIDPSELTLRLRNTLAARGRRIRPEAEDHVTPAGSDPRIRAIADVFLVRLRAKIAAMAASLEAGDLRELSALAHWLKGAAGTVGLHEFTAPAEALERLAEGGRPEALAAAIRELGLLAERIDARDGA
jgi:DNA-binding response OmpR family regulator